MPTKTKTPPARTAGSQPQKKARVIIIAKTPVNRGRGVSNKRAATPAAIRSKSSATTRPSARLKHKDRNSEEEESESEEEADEEAASSIDEEDVSNEDSGEEADEDGEANDDEENDRDNSEEEDEDDDDDSNACDEDEEAEEGDSSEDAEDEENEDEDRSDESNSDSGDSGNDGRRSSRISARTQVEDERAPRRPSRLRGKTIEQSVVSAPKASRERTSRGAATAEEPRRASLRIAGKDTEDESQEKHNPGRSTKRKPQSGKPGKNKGFAVGTEVLCKWSGNGEEYPARVLKRRPVSSSTPSLYLPLSTSTATSANGMDGQSTDNYEYYVRYTVFDHRLDEWVPSSRIRESNASSSITIQSAPALSPSPSACSGDEDETHQVKNIHSIELGKYEIETWYYSPYPEEYCKESKLFLCEFCLKYMKRKHTLERHAEKCEWRHPPGNEIYREGELSVFEVDGKKQRVYCQNLCLLSKLFLDHKTLYYDVDPFYFYILTECDEQGAHVVGYFSKEKFSPDGYNLACIMTLPPYQRKGYGSFLISLSYELSKREGVEGSPEKPLSDLGRLGYKSYWSRIILSLLRQQRGTDLSIRDIARMTAISTDDIVDTLKDLNLVRFWKGKHVLVISQKLINAYLDSTAGKRFRLIDPSKLTWTPRRTGRVGESRRSSS